MATVALTERQWHTLMEQDRALTAVREECAHQLAVWHGDDHPPVVWLGIITEQVGQAASAILSPHAASEAETEKQLIHIAAVCVSAIESLRRRNAGRFMASANMQEENPRR